MKCWPTYQDSYRAEFSYDVVARAKGLSTLQVVFRHVIKNSILPVVSR
jgi:ABC-type dipeptide/oligopeptide/nickel transport system permease component